MKIFIYDKGGINQGAGIPDLPTEDEVLFAYSPGLKPVEATIVGNELWRMRILHRLIDDGHQIVWGSKRRIMPSEALDFDLQRVLEQRPDLAPFIRERDPMLDAELWDVHKGVEQAYAEELTDVENRGATIDTFAKWYKQDKFGPPPDDVDVAVFHIMRANPIAGFEQIYQIGKFLEQGTPVILYDNNRQIAGTVNGFKAVDIPWPHPLCLYVAPYDVDFGYGTPELIDFPYVKSLELDPAPVSERTGAMYVGNEYDRWRHMVRVMLPIVKQGLPLTIWGKYDSDDGQRMQRDYPEAKWMGRTEGSCRARKQIAHAHATFNVLRGSYMSIGLITYRTFDSPCYGTLEIADRKIHRIEQFVPKRYLVKDAKESAVLVKKIMAMGDDEYREELEAQREIVKKYDFDSYFMPRYYELLEMAISQVGAVA